MKGLKIALLKGKLDQHYLDEIADLRITIFKEYPYLYDGDLAYERNYLKTYGECNEAIVVLVTDNGKVVGASTAIPLEFEVRECQQPFIDSGMPVSNIFYFGESLLLPEYRGRGIYRHYFQEREAAALKYGCTFSTFCAIVRQEDDPRRPRDYTSLEEVWSHFGYKKYPKLCAHFTFKEIDSTLSTNHEMVFWMKNL